MATKKHSNQHYLHLSHDVYSFAQAAVKKRGRRLSWLRFARPTSTGWSFFKKRNVPWDVLHEIHQEVQNLHKTCCSKEIVTDTFSQLINMSSQNLMRLTTTI